MTVLCKASNNKLVAEWTQSNTIIKEKIIMQTQEIIISIAYNQDSSSPSKVHLQLKFLLINRAIICQYM